MKFRVWCDSGANIKSCREEIIDLDELGISESQFREMSDDEQEEMFKDIAFQNLDWGWEEIE